MDEIEQPKFKWYEIIRDDEIGQGDFFDDVPILIQPDTIPVAKEELSSVEIDADSILLYNVVVMTQSCDLSNNNMKDDDLVTLCPRSAYSSLYGKNRWKPLKNGRVVGAHLLSECDLKGHEFEYQVVDLTRIFSIPYGFLKRFANHQGERIRLLPPYREHLSQSFARRFMRVGLPIDLPRDYPY
jgi:hypothetical protein